MPSAFRRVTCAPFAPTYPCEWGGAGASPIACSEDKSCSRFLDMKLARAAHDSSEPFAAVDMLGLRASEQTQRPSSFFFGAKRRGLRCVVHRTPRCRCDGSAIGLKQVSIWPAGGRRGQSAGLTVDGIGVGSAGMQGGGVGEAGCHEPVRACRVHMRCLARPYALLMCTILCVAPRVTCSDGRWQSARRPESEGACTRRPSQLVRIHQGVVVGRM